MKPLLRLGILAVILTASVLLWKKYHRVAPVIAPIPVPVVEKVEAPKLDLSPRTWTNRNGRTFDGALVSVKNGQVIICRVTDSVYFQIPASTLSPDDQTFLQKQAALATEGPTGFVEQLHGVYTLSRKLGIKGYLVRVTDSVGVGGWRNDRVNPAYWFLLSTKLHGADSGSLWVRVDEKTYLAREEGNLITQENLRDFMDGKGGFSESLPWPRPNVTLIEAQYGPNAKGADVTQKLMRLASQNSLPVEVGPAAFQADIHSPASWELTVAWRTPNGEVRRTLRDGSILTWP